MNNLVIDGKILFSRKESSAEETELFTFLGLLYLICNTTAFKSYQTFIPNGADVPDPCRTNEIWAAVGHVTATGGTDRNPFGLDFVVQGKEWTEELCQMDSDGDGRSNGEELGDPDCMWRRGIENVGMGTALSHPGICDPQESPYCKQKNGWLNCESEKFECDAINESETRNFTIQFPRMEIPRASTTYICMIVDAPTDQDYHIVASSPIIDNTDMVHHILLYGCVEDGPYGPLEQSSNEPFTCGMGATMQCMTDLLSVWVIGSKGECMHKDAGFRIGPNGYKKLAIQMHWTNSDRRGNLHDSSGMVVHITPRLRPYDAGILWTGQSYMEIPPGQSSYSINGSCTEECTKAMFKEDIKLIGALSHMHLTGKGQTVEQYRGGQLLRTVLETKTYSYNRPEPLMFPEPITVKAGDELRTMCTYDTSSRKRITFGGDSTDDEMCIAFIQFYPKNIVPMPLCMNFKDLSLCKTAPQYKESFPDLLHGCDVLDFAALGNPVVFDFVLNVRSKCRPYFCLEECKKALRKMQKHPCLKGDVWEYLKFQLLNIKTKTFMSDQLEKLMAAYTSCDRELGEEVGVTKGENNMVKYMNPDVDCSQCQKNTPQSQATNTECDLKNSASAIFKDIISIFMPIMVTLVSMIV
ncbi:hypothetical protein FSP39_016749 [Pinctada imbricata]|uniref:Uncharacterized protein n=1 Tax=Pinctada imbricata TaxID=66713 RepID=A0AA88Y5P7_PINIB|nr:hypothetical protein FSP39_016749 [Pinctada imbricata]